jgi:hypothetical protein
MKGEELNAHVFKDTPKQMDLLLDKMVLFEGDSIVQLSNDITAFTLGCLFRHVIEP